MTVKIPDFSGVRVLVAGDLMLDRYWHGSTERISPEAPVPVVHVRTVEQKPGGAGNVALNLAALGSQPALVAVAGNDEAGDALQRLLTESGVTCHLHRVSGAPTITKLRVMSRHQQLIRLDFEDGLPNLATLDLLPPFSALLDSVSVVILSDYGKGALRDPQVLIQAARARGLPVLVDPKGRDFRRYRGASLITPNRAEFEAVVGVCADAAEMVQRAQTLIAHCDLGALLITRGEEGMTLVQQGLDPVHLPTQAREVFDVTGAGDTVIAGMAVALGAGLNLAQAMVLANLAAGVVVGKLGTATVTAQELRAALRDRAEVERGVLSEARLLAAVMQARNQGERIVFTNGCFDLLHAGHVTYLQRARALGDRLIVAVNDDDSVRRLKGTGRPVNALAERMTVLAALGAVDWVVPFTEDTPARLIEAVLPDVLVKGGDYRVEQIAGHETVLAHGGTVEILDFLPGCSTTAMLGRIARDPAA